MDFSTLDLLLRCSREFNSKRIRSHDLTDTECMICTYVSKNPDCAQEDVVAALKADKTTVAKALASLEEKRLVHRTVDNVDRRRKHIRLTKTGREKISDLADIHDRWLSQVMSCLPEDDRRLFERCCERLLDAAEKLNEAPESKA